MAWIYPHYDSHLSINFQSFCQPWRFIGVLLRRENVQAISGHLIIVFLEELKLEGSQELGMGVWLMEIDLDCYKSCEELTSKMYLCPAISWEKTKFYIDQFPKNQELL